MAGPVITKEKWISIGTTPERLKEVEPAHSRPQTTPQEVKMQIWELKKTQKLEGDWMNL